LLGPTPPPLVPGCCPPAAFLLLQNRAPSPSQPCPHTHASESNAAQACIAGWWMLFMRTKGPQAGEMRGAIPAAACSVCFCRDTLDGSRLTRNRRTAPTKELMPPCHRPPAAAIVCRLYLAAAASEKQPAAAAAAQRCGLLLVYEGGKSAYGSYRTPQPNPSAFTAN
jgi:hypothetical protein